MPPLFLAARVLAVAVCFLATKIVTSQVPEPEISALSKLYDVTDGELWRWRPDSFGFRWNFSVGSDGHFLDNPCSSEWQGVTCSRDAQLCTNQMCHVTSLSLSRYNLAGIIPPEIGSFVELHSLDLSFNLLAGPIPSEVGDLLSLEWLDIRNNIYQTGPLPLEIGNLVLLQHLYLDYNALTGRIPPELGNLTALETLELDNNVLTGPIPFEIGNCIALTRLTLEDNVLTGPILPNISRLVLLEWLDLSVNDLSGSLPSGFSSLVGLSRLDLSDNSLTGNVPPEVGSLARLDRLYFSNNHLTGHIPPHLGNCVVLKRLYLDGNSFSGPIPPEIGNLAELEWLDFNSNALTGMIPPDLSRLTLLERLYLDYNTLTGPIPSEIGVLTALERIYLGSNKLVAEIPSEIGNLSVLEWLDLDVNTLTGTIPPEVGHLTVLEWLDLGFNSLTGCIPDELCGLREVLGHIDLSSNTLTGYIPAELSCLTGIYWMDFSHNFLTGHIPPGLVSMERIDISYNHITGSIPAEISGLQLLEWLDIHNNGLTGPIPPDFSNLVSLEWLDLNDNAVTGSIPPEIGNLANLEHLFVQSNMLTGGIGGVFNASAQLSLAVVDMSDNLLTGHSFNDVFLLPKLEVLALSVNCFQAELPDAMCEATTIEVLSLNGLGAAEGCANTVKFPLSGVSMFNAIGGTLPECVWHLPHLASLHLTGNGLTGSAISLLPDPSSLEDLSLSHNKFSGTIPLNVQSVRIVDLSNNQFSGKYEDVVEIWTNQYIDLEINRLSGHLSVSKLENETEVNILRGNMFSCASIPSNDEFADDYICGSENLNESLYVLGSTLGVVFFVVLAVGMSVTIITRSTPSSSVLSSPVVRKTVGRFCEYMGAISQANLSADAKLLPIAALCDKFKACMRLFAQLLCVMLVVGAPLYFVRGSDGNAAYSTHSNTYSWFWTLAYLHGTVPSSLVVMTWLATVSSFFYHIILAPLYCRSFSGGKGMVSGNASERKDTTEMNKDGRRKANYWTFLMFLTNGAITITVNALFIYATQQAFSTVVLFYMQLSLATFRLLYAYCGFPLLSQSITDPVANTTFRLRLLVTNNLAIPCFVTAFASPSCFQGLLVAADAVSTPYTHERCSTFLVGENVNHCILWNRVLVESAPVIPPFVYNNQCASVLLTSYIPVLILGFSIQVMLIFISSVIIFRLGLWHRLRSVTHGILWPEFWLNIDTSTIACEKVENDPSCLLRSNTIMCFDILNNLIVMLTFGLSSPLLAIAVTCTVVSKMIVLVLLVGRFTSVLRKDCAEDRHHFALIALAKIRFPLMEVLQQSFWTIMWTSALFFTLVCWDIASDDVGWLESVWIPIVVLSYPTVLWVVTVLVKRNRIDIIPPSCELNSLDRTRSHTSVGQEKTFRFGDVEIPAPRCTVDEAAVTTSPMHVLS